MKTQWRFSEGRQNMRFRITSGEFAWPHTWPQTYLSCFPAQTRCFCPSNHVCMYFYGNKESSVRRRVRVGCVGCVGGMLVNRGLRVMWRGRGVPHACAAIDTRSVCTYVPAQCDISVLQHRSEHCYHYHTEHYFLLYFLSILPFFSLLFFFFFPLYFPFFFSFFFSRMYVLYRSSRILSVTCCQNISTALVAVYMATNNGTKKNLFPCQRKWWAVHQMNVYCLHQFALINIVGTHVVLVRLMNAVYLRRLWWV